MSDQEFFMFCHDNPQLKLERESDGKIIFMSPSGSSTSNIILKIAFEIELYNRQHQLGEVFESSAGFTLPDGSVRAADIALVTYQQLDTITEAEYQKFAPVTPLFIVEVASPSDRLADQQAKMDVWMRNGVQLGWLIDPNAQQAWVYRQNQAPQHIDNFNEALKGGSILPEFTLELSLRK